MYLFEDGKPHGEHPTMGECGCDECERYEYLNSFNYDWQGTGLLIQTPAGECYLQGEEGSELHDELELIEDWETVVIVLSQYEGVCDEN